jgi:hypothetical protein
LNNEAKGREELHKKGKKKRKKQKEVQTKERMINPLAPEFSFKF